MQQRERVFSGVQPTGKIHIGNYVGALSLWAENQDLYDNIFCVVDLHALTIPEAIDPARLHEKTRETAAPYVACGIDPRNRSSLCSRGCRRTPSCSGFSTASHPSAGWSA